MTVTDTDGADGTAEGALTARQRQGAASRRRILDATEQAVAERGFAATSISRIAGSSGLPASSIYWHFSSKGELLAAVVERGARRWLAAQPRWPEFDGDLGAFFEAIGTATDGRPDFLRLFMVLSLERHEQSPDQARRLAEEVWHRVRRSLGCVIADTFELDEAQADDLARFALACIDGVFVDAHVDPDGTDMARVFAQIPVALAALAADRRSTESADSEETAP